LIDNSQQMKPYRARAGFPLSSSQFDDIFDSAVYDIIVMLTQDIASMTAIFKTNSDILSRVEALAFREFNKDIDFVQKDHTENWRTL